MAEAKAASSRQPPQAAVKTHPPPNRTLNRPTARPTAQPPTTATRPGPIRLQQPGGDLPRREPRLCGRPHLAALCQDRGHQRLRRRGAGAFLFLPLMHDDGAGQRDTAAWWFQFSYVSQRGSHHPPTHLPPPLPVPPPQKKNQTTRSEAYSSPPSSWAPSWVTSRPTWSAAAGGLWTRPPSRWWAPRPCWAPRAARR
jgi:hypothetical protein